MLAALTLVHTALSLIGIAAGAVVVLGLLSGKRLDRWTALFLATTVATSATGYLFPFHKLLPSHIVGAISLVTLAIAIVARYPRQLKGGWRATYVITATLALYLNVFVGVVQAFLKVPALHALAPTQNEPPFVVAQTIVLFVFLGLTIAAAKRFRLESVRAMSKARPA